MFILLLTCVTYSEESTIIPIRLFLCCEWPDTPVASLPMMMFLPHRMIMVVIVRRFIAVTLVMVVAPRPGTWFALLFRGRFRHLFLRELVGQRVCYFHKRSGGEAFPVKVDHRYPGVGRFGKERVDGNGPQKGDFHHLGQLFTFVFSEKIDGISAPAGI